MLFIDFSSAFNTIQPHLMIEKLKKMGNLEICCKIEKILKIQQELEIHNIAIPPSLRSPPAWE